MPCRQTRFDRGFHLIGQALRSPVCIHWSQHSQRNPPIRAPTLRILPFLALAQTSLVSGSKSKAELVEI